MREFIGIAMILAGVVLGLYVGVWLCFVGGIVDVIEQIRAESLEAMAVALGIGKIFFAGAIGWLAAVSLILPGVLVGGFKE